MSQETKAQREQRLNARAGTALEAPKTSLQTRLAWKGSKEFRHDLFKLGVAKMKKNVSYKKFQPEIQMVEHAHFFHSHDMKGKTMVHSQAVGGHFHEVHIEWERDGEDLILKKAECGPALRQVQKRTRSGKWKTVIEAVRYERGDAAVDGSDDDDVEITGFEEDTHTHELLYVGSELISPQKIRTSQEQDRAKLAAMMAADRNVVGAPAPKNEHAGKTAGDEGLDATVDGARIQEGGGE